MNFCCGAKGVVVGIVMFLIAVAIGGIVLWQRAENQAFLARQQVELARRGTYNIQLARARDLWEREPVHALDLLNDTSRAPLDLRDFTWGFLYRLSNKMRMTLTGHTELVYSVAFSPDGKTLASLSLDNTIKLWKAANYEVNIIDGDNVNSTNPVNSSE